MAAGLVWRAVARGSRAVGGVLLGSLQLVVHAVGWTLRRSAAALRGESPPRSRASPRRGRPRRIAVGKWSTRRLTWTLLAGMVGVSGLLLLLIRGRVAEDLPDALLIPVAGVTAEELRRSFEAPRSGGRLHRAIDIPAPRGTAVVASMDGTILRTSLGGLAGLAICLRSRSGTLDLVYAHLDELAPAALAGRTVRRGENLGTVGSTGNARADGPHLHFQVVRTTTGARCGAGEALDPYDLLVGETGAGAKSVEARESAGETEEDPR